MRRLTLLMTMSIGCSLGVLRSAGASDVDLGYLSTLLEEGMTTRQVSDAVGYRPSSVEQQTCGTQTAQPWECRIWIFSTGLHQLRVTFQKNGSEWIVNSWQVW